MKGNGAQGRCPEKPIRMYVQGGVFPKLPKACFPSSLRCVSQAPQGVSPKLPKACFPSPKAWPKSQRAPHGEQRKATRGRAASRERNDGTVVAGTHALAGGMALFCRAYSIRVSIEYPSMLPNVLCSPALCACVRACPGWSGVVNTSPGNPEPNDGDKRRPQTAAWLAWLLPEPAWILKAATRVDVQMYGVPRASNLDAHPGRSRCMMQAVGCGL